MKKITLGLFFFLAFGLTANTNILSSFDKNTSIQKIADKCREDSPEQHADKGRVDKKPYNRADKCRNNGIQKIADMGRIDTLSTKA